MEKKEKGKSIKESVFSTRNKAVILYSRMFGSEKTNDILDKTFSDDGIVSKILDAERHGFKISYTLEENDGGVLIEKEIKNPNLDGDKCEEKYWAMVRKNLLIFYDEETTDAVIEHFHPLLMEDGSEILYNHICKCVTDDSPNSKQVGIDIEFHTFDVKKYSNIEKKIGNKIIKYDIKWEDIVSVFIESHIQVFG
jgi:hypothetical protein